MHDSIILVILPLLMISFSSNARIELIFTVPLGVISNVIIMRRSLENEGENMACFVEPEEYV